MKGASTRTARDIALEKGTDRSKFVEQDIPVAPEPQDIDIALDTEPRAPRTEQVPFKLIG